MVWIHGFLPVVPEGRGRVSTLGSSTEYPGHVLTAFNDVIVVTFNYRLGILGFFNEPHTDVKGNYGMYDQVHVTLVAVVYTCLNMKYSRPSDQSTSKLNLNHSYIGLFQTGPFRRYCGHFEFYCFK